MKRRDVRRRVRASRQAQRSCDPAAPQSLRSPRAWIPDWRCRRRRPASPRHPAAASASPPRPGPPAAHSPTALRPRAFGATPEAQPPAAPARHCPPSVRRPHRGVTRHRLAHHVDADAATSARRFRRTPAPRWSCPRRRHRCRPSRDGCSFSAAACRRVEELVLRRQDRRAARQQAREDLRLLVGHALDRAHALQVRRRDPRDHRDVRLHHLRARRDLARRVHADLEDRPLGLARHPRQRQRHAPVIVERLVRPVRMARRADRCAPAFPSRWSCRPNPSPPRRSRPSCAPAPQAPSFSSAAQHIVDQQARMPAQHIARHERRLRARRERVRRRNHARRAHPSAPRTDCPAAASACRSTRH